MLSIQPGTIVRAKRLGWNETEADTITATDILDPYDFPTNDLEGPYETQHVSDPTVNSYVQHLVAGQPADPDTIEPIEQPH
jgi:hypothetical protein